MSTRRISSAIWATCSAVKALKLACSAVMFLLLSGCIADNEFCEPWRASEENRAACEEHYIGPRPDLRGVVFDLAPPVVDMDLTGRDLIGWCAPLNWPCERDGDCCPTKNQFSEKAWPSVCERGVCKIGWCGGPCVEGGSDCARPLKGCDGAPIPEALCIGWFCTDPCIANQCQSL